MIISAILRERNRRKDLEDRQNAVEGGRQEGRLEIQALWEAWNRRRTEAEQRGEEFDELPPGTGSRNGPGGHLEN